MRICQATFKVLGKENTYQQNFKSTFYHFFKEFISIFKTGNLKMNGFLMNRICKTRRCGYKILVKLSQTTVHRRDTILVINSLELCNVLVQVLLATSKAELVSIIQILFSELPRVSRLTILANQEIGWGHSFFPNLSSRKNRGEKLRKSRYQPFLILPSFA